MYRMFIYILSAFLITFFSSCSDSQHDKPLKISVTSWIGYAPLFYAQEMGWLDKNNIKLIDVVSFSESMDLYASGNAEAFVGTQYEYSVIKESVPALIPVMMFGRSFGADMVMSNRSVAKLQKAQGKIDAYLEMDSINHTLLDDFIKQNMISEKRINYINKDQVEITAMKRKAFKYPSLVVTYKPFDAALAERGFTKLASTKDSLDLIVVDALYTTKQTLQQHNQKFIKLKAYVVDALQALKKDPEAYFKMIESHLNGLSYDAFLTKLKDLQWLEGKLTHELQQRLLASEFPIADLL